MANVRLRIGLIGTGDWGSCLLNQILNMESCEVVVAITSRRDPLKLARGFQPAADIGFFEEGTGYSILQQRSLEAVIVAGWPFKIPSGVIYGVGSPMINVHASLLPKYRGPEPILQQILHNERDSGVTFHLLDEGWDTGPLYVVSPFVLTDRDTSRSAFFKAARAAAKGLQDVVRLLRSEKLKVKRQSEIDATYYGMTRQEDLLVHEGLSVQVFERMARAYGGVHPLIFKESDKLFEIREFEILRTTEFERRVGKILQLRDGSLLVKDFKVY